MTDPNATDHLEVADTDHHGQPDDRATSAAQRDADAAPGAHPDDARRVAGGTDQPAEQSDQPADVGSGQRVDGAGDVDGAADAEEPTVDLEQLADADPRSKAEVLGALLLAEADRDEYLDDLRRARAEFENYRRRVTRESAAQRRAGVAEAASALLEVLDDLDRTLEAAAASSDDQLAKGVELVASKLTNALQGLGVQRIAETGVPFDPNLHEAVQQVPRAADGRDGDGASDPTVAQVFRPGYRLDDRVLRAAMVVVEG